MKTIHRNFPVTVTHFSFVLKCHPKKQEPGDIWVYRRICFITKNNWGRDLFFLRILYIINIQSHIFLPTVFQPFVSLKYSADESNVNILPHLCYQADSTAHLFEFRDLEKVAWSGCDKISKSYCWESSTVRRNEGERGGGGEKQSVNSTFWGLWHVWIIFHTLASQKNESHSWAFGLLSFGIIG